jgi:hypothetical protein
MVTGNENYIIDTLNSMPINEARKAIASGQFGSHGRPDRAFASEYLASKEAMLHNNREDEILSISRKALAISEEANLIASKAKSEARCANKIAIIAIILPTIMAAIAIIIAWPVKN